MMSLGGIASSVCRNLVRSSVRRLSGSATKCSAYDSDGKTTATILNQQLGSNIMVDSYSITGFRLNNGMYVVGPVAVFPKTVIGWNIKDDNDISEESLSLFTLIEPKLDILVIGFGDKWFNSSKLDRELLKLRKQHKMNIELLSTERAIATYNFLVSESRWVAAALIPPKVVDITDEDIGAITRRQPLTEAQQKAR